MKWLENLFGKKYLDWYEYQEKVHNIEQNYWNTYAQKQGIKTSK
ncbi:MAG TPA: hypothetical protein VJK72_03775 [Candidatus Nanoarchaeia archaeon]|nr:hypothetical protein [Candidatus Nanoarchaeia archaeon]